MTLPAFTSVSLDDKVADGFGDHLLFPFTRVRGVRIRSLSAVPKEAEVLAPPPSVHRIVAVAMFHGSLVVTLESVHLLGLPPLSMRDGVVLRVWPWMRDKYSVIAQRLELARESSGKGSRYGPGSSHSARFMSMVEEASAGLRPSSCVVSARCSAELGCGAVQTGSHALPW